MIQVDIAGIDAETKKTWLKTVSLKKGSTVSAALNSIGLDSQTETAVFNERTTADTVLMDGDRLDVLSPLTADPMTARRLRIENHDCPNELQRGRHGSKHRLLAL